MDKKEKNKKDLMLITRFFKELDADDFREFVVWQFGILGYVYLFAVTFLSIPAENEEIRTVGMTLVSTVIFGRMIVEFVNSKRKNNDKVIEDEDGDENFDEEIN
jgi:Na+(H+)/acetate symporter ActP